MADLTVEQAIAHIEHSLFGELDARIDPVRLLNQAGEYLVGVHTWKFLERPVFKADARGSISIPDSTFSAGAISEDGRTLTVDEVSGVGAFQTYDYLPGDTIEITAATPLRGSSDGLDGSKEVSGVIGTHLVEAKLSDSQLLLADVACKLASTGAPQSAASVTFKSADGFAAVRMPDDFAEIVGYAATDSLVGNLQATTYKDLMDLRTDSVQTTTQDFWFAIAHGAKRPNGAPFPRMEIWPTPSSTSREKFSIFYRAGWGPVGGDGELVRLPEYIHALYLQIVRAFALGYEEEDAGDVNARLTAIHMGPMMEAAKRRDGQVQDFFGPMKGGAVGGGVTIWDWGQGTTVSDPA